MINEKLLGTIPDNINEIKNNIGKMPGKVLWTNPNLTINFEEQTITLSNDDYDYLEIFYLHSKSTKFAYSYKIPAGYGARLFIATLDGICYREIQYVSKIKFQVKSSTKPTGLSQDNGIAIPICIIGEKFN